MSTQINVTVDSGGLADEDKQQRQSMRWAKLEKDGKSLVYRTGLDERGKALNQQGKDPTGKPKPSTPAPVLRRDEPVANRSNTLQVGHYWRRFVSTNTGVSEDGYGLYVASSGSTLGSSGANFSTIPTAQQDTYFYPGVGYPADTGFTRYMPSTNPYPTSDLSWQYTIQTVYNGSTWSFYAEGPRTAALSRGFSATSRTIAIPTGGKGVIVLEFYMRFGKEKDFTALHQANGYVIKFGSSPPTAAQLAAAEQYIATYYGYPGAFVPTYQPESQWTITTIKDHDFTETRAFRVTDTIVREITVPSYFDDYNKVEYNSNGTIKSPLFAQLDTFGEDADLFYKLNQLKQFTSPQSLKRFNTVQTTSSVQKDTSKGAFASPSQDPQDLFSRDDPFYYKYRRKNESSYASIAKAQLSLSPSRDKTKPPELFDTIFDNDAKAYCQTMCLLLGFSPSDLTP